MSIAKHIEEHAILGLGRVGATTPYAIAKSGVAVTSANPKVTPFPVRPNIPIRVKGGAGGEVFNISICPVE